MKSITRYILAFAALMLGVLTGFGQVNETVTVVLSSGAVLKGRVEVVSGSTLVVTLTNEAQVAQVRSAPAPSARYDFEQRNYGTGQYVPASRTGGYPGDNLGYRQPDRWEQERVSVDQRSGLQRTVANNRGVVVGTVVGAGAGAVIGNNTGKGDAKKGAIIGGVAGALLGAVNDSTRKN